jgi:hypothetical protein
VRKGEYFGTRLIWTCIDILLTYTILICPQIVFNIKKMVTTNENMTHKYICVLSSQLTCNKVVGTTYKSTYVVCSYMMKFKHHLYSLCVSLEYNKSYNFILVFGIYLWLQFLHKKEKKYNKDSTPLIFEFYCFDCVKLYCCINQLL